MLRWLREGDGPSRFQGMAAMELLAMPHVLSLPPAVQVTPPLCRRHLSVAATSGADLD